MSEATARELRGQIRAWRQGRSTATLGDVLQDAYVGVFATLVIGSMAVSVVVHLGALSDQWCTTAACRSGRTTLPWLIGLALLTLALAMARLFGPVFVTPATASWLAPAPVERRGLLRPRLLFWAPIVAVPTLGLTAAVATLSGFAASGIWAYAVTASLLAVALAGIAAAAQAADAHTVTRGLTWTLLAVTWAGLLWLATGTTPGSGSPAAGIWWWLAAVVAVVLAVVAMVVGMRGLDRLRLRDIAPGGQLAPGMSGALAGLDLSLSFDVLTSHLGRGRGVVRSRRSARYGTAALIWTDLIRLRRRPQPVLVLLGAIVVPYAAAAVGTGVVAILIASITGFLAGLPLLIGVRVLTRTPGLARMLPFSPSEARRTALQVPWALMMIFGFATAPALQHAIGMPFSRCLALSLGIGMTALAAGTRWMTGRPPDYSRPLVSTPAGGVPTNLYSSVLRGFDIAVLCSAPMLLITDLNGVLISLVLSIGTLGYLTGRE